MEQQNTPINIPKNTPKKSETGKSNYLFYGLVLLLFIIGCILVWIFKPCPECPPVTDGCTNVISNITENIEEATPEEKNEIQNGCLSFVNTVATSTNDADKQIVYTVCETITKSYVNGIVGLETITIYDDDANPDGRKYKDEEIKKLTDRINPNITSDEKQKAFVIKQQLFFAYFSLYTYLISFNNLTAGTTWQDNEDLQNKVKTVMDQVVNEIEERFKDQAPYNSVNFKEDVYQDDTSGEANGLWSLLKISVTLKALEKLRGDNNTNSFGKMFEMFSKKDLYKK